MTNQKYVCVDLDGTIAHYKEWKGEDFFGEPVAGVQSALELLKKEGWRIIIYTTRINSKLIEDYLYKNSIPFDHINYNPNQPKNAIGGKPYADVYIDDRGIQFNGNWAITAAEVLQFSPWELRPEKTQESEYRKESIDFLRRDYGEVFSQLREYDKQVWEITKFCFLQLVGSIGAVWAVFSLASAEDAPNILNIHWELVSSIILIISFVFSLLVVQYIMRTRVYFSTAARYINDHRDFFLSSMPLGFSNRSGFYKTYNYPKSFDKGSTQLISIYFVSVISSFNFGFGIGLLVNYLRLPIDPIVLGILIWLVFSFLLVSYTVFCLKAKSDKNTERDVFGIKKT